MSSNNSIYKVAIIGSVLLYFLHIFGLYFFLGSQINTVFVSSFFMSTFILVFIIFLLTKIIRLNKESIQKFNEYNQQLDKNIEEKTKRLNSLLEIFDKHVIASRTDTKGNITYASKAYENISGYSQEELIGKPHNIVRHPDMSKKVFKNMWEKIQNGETWEGEVKNLRKDGSSYWVHATINPYYENGKLTGYSAVREDITAQKNLEKLNDELEHKVQERTQEIENQLYTDSLTGLNSYQALSRDIEKRDYTFTTLMLINIDNFQNINGLYGFEAGNEVLKEFATVLEPFSSKRGYRLYRIYADEFVLFKNCEFTNIDEYYEDLVNLRQAIQNRKFLLKSINTSINIDVTIGISMGQENPLITVDMALRHAKEHKLDFQAYNSTLDIKEKLQKTLEWKERIAKGLLDDRFIPVFQPILNKEQEIIKYEVLTRLKDRDDPKLLLAPGEFLEESINTKQYNDITKRVLNQALEIMKNSDKIFSINISYDDIYNDVLIKFLENIILNNKEIANRLVIEILEDKEIKSLEVMTNFIQQFRSYGVKIAIDDFGIGHSNLSHIMDIEPDYLKIDGSFIKNIAYDKKSYALTKSVVEFCKELDIIVIAEYVHDKKTFEIVDQLGVDEFQGYYFSPPIIL